MSHIEFTLDDRQVEGHRPIEHIQTPVSSMRNCSSLMSNLMSVVIIRYLMLIGTKIDAISGLILYQVLVIHKW
jgi:hypothetical protein